MEIPEGISPEVFKKVHAEYIASIPELVRTIKMACENLKKDWNEQNLTELRMIVHKIAGNASTFGFIQVTRICKSWDAELTGILKNFSTQKVDSQFFVKNDQLATEVAKEFQNER